MPYTQHKREQVGVRQCLRPSARQAFARTLGAAIVFDNLFFYGFSRKPDSLGHSADRRLRCAVGQRRR